MDKAKIKILVVEDEKDIAELINHHLTTAGYKVTLLHDGSEVLNRLEKDIPKLIVLDVMLPGMNGFELCRAIKAHPNYKNIPIIFLTAKNDEVDRIVGFELGIDDYVTKPFSPRELMLRIRAILSRSVPILTSTEEKQFEYDTLKIDWEGHRVFIENKEVTLTKLEFNLLKHLVKSKGRVLSRDYLLDQVWGYNTDLETRTVDTHVKRLRDKLLKAGDYIETVRGVGYRFE